MYLETIIFFCALALSAITFIGAIDYCINKWHPKEMVNTIPGSTWNITLVLIILCSLLWSWLFVLLH